MQPIDMAFVIAITAFFKEQFGISGKVTMLIAFLVGVVLWGVPLLVAALPAYGQYIDGFFQFVKIWLAAMGSADFTKIIAAKIGSEKE